MESTLNILWYDELDSTNSQMLRNVSEYSDLDVIAARNQFAGRGQRGNSWLISKGKNLTFSMMLKGNTDKVSATLGKMPARKQFIISEIVTIAVRDFLRSRGINAKIKWPNDIYVSNKKICGMLIENGLSPDGCIAYSVVGIGLNVNQDEFPPELVNPTSMTLLTKQTYNLEESLAELCALIASKFELLDSPEIVKQDYLDGLYRIDQMHTYTDCATSEQFKARIKSITDFGQLVVETEKGELKEFAFKEISYII
ncbi:MAG: biotin--[acetyl-CoA-carboxylase] ligase [Bacteroidales bacterium]|nr:biotin--[acetyl-CoA-carboxylase] ligase [Bacteroidales bacterium]